MALAIRFGLPVRIIELSWLSVWQPVGSSLFAFIIMGCKNVRYDSSLELLNRPQTVVYPRIELIEVVYPRIEEWCIQELKNTVT